MTIEFKYPMWSYSKRGDPPEVILDSSKEVQVNDTPGEFGFANVWLRCEFCCTDASGVIPIVTKKERDALEGHVKGIEPFPYIENQVCGSCGDLHSAEVRCLQLMEEEEEEQ